MNEKDKNSVGIALAVAGLAAMLLLQKGSAEPGGSGGGLGSDSGGSMAANTQGGGAQPPQVNIDFPAIPAFNIPTKKEEKITEPSAKTATWAGMTYDPSAFKYSPENPSSLYTTGVVTNPFTQAETADELRHAVGSQEDLFALSKKEQSKEVAPWGFSLLNPLYDFAVEHGYGNKSGYQTTAQMTRPASVISSSDRGNYTVNKPASQDFSKQGGGNYTGSSGSKKAASLDYTSQGGGNYSGSSGAQLNSSGRNKGGGGTRSGFSGKW